MTSPLCVATGGWCRRVFHYRPPTPMYRNSPPLCTIVLQIPSLMPLKIRKVQLTTSVVTWAEAVLRTFHPIISAAPAPVFGNNCRKPAVFLLRRHGWNVYGWASSLETPLFTQASCILEGLFGRGCSGQLSHFSASPAASPRV